LCPLHKNSLVASISGRQHVIGIAYIRSQGGNVFGEFDIVVTADSARRSVADPLPCGGNHANEVRLFVSPILLADDHCLGVDEQSSGLDPALGDFVEQARKPQRRAGREEHLSERVRSRSGRQMVIDVLLLTEENAMARVRATSPDEEVVLRREVGNDVSFALAAVLTSDDHINESLGRAPIEPKAARSSCKNVLCCVANRVDHDVGG
jgi:hypothetical protein